MYFDNVKGWLLAINKSIGVIYIKTYYFQDLIILYITNL